MNNNPPYRLVLVDSAHNIKHTIVYGWFTAIKHTALHYHRGLVAATSTSLSDDQMWTILDQRGIAQFFRGTEIDPRQAYFEVVDTDIKEATHD